MDQTERLGRDGRSPVHCQFRLKYYRTESVVQITVSVIGIGPIM